MKRKIMECLDEYSSRIRNLTLDPNYNDKMINNARTWLVDTLEKTINDAVDMMNDWSIHCQKNIDSFSV